MDFIESGTAENTIVLFHGYGADMHDLSGIAPAIEGNENFRWIFPNGIRKIEIAPQYFGRAWFPINLQEYERALREGRTRDLSRQRPTGLDQAVEEAEKFIESLNVPRENLILGGFSQGAMLAVELVARRRENILGLLILSGNLLDEDNLRKIAFQNKGQKFYQSHGTHDTVLPIEQAKRLEELLVGAGWSGHLDVFRGGHEIPFSVIQNVGYFLRQATV